MTLIDLQLESLFNVRNRIALVSGGGSGIGQMIATGLVANGSKVYIVSRKEKQLKEVLSFDRLYSLSHLTSIRFRKNSREWALESVCI